MTNKELIAERFGKAAHTYDSEADIQKAIAIRMYGMLDRERPYDTILEIGCGTGIYSRLLETLGHRQLILNDITPEMEGKVRTSGVRYDRFILGDAEHITFPDNTSLITSCSAIQWFDDIPVFFRKCHKSLEAGGILAVSSFGKDNLKEIRAITKEGLRYMDDTELAGTARECGFSVKTVMQETIVKEFDCPVGVLRHLKHTGVTGVRREKWTKGDMERFCKEYLEMSGGNVRLTYNPIYLIAEKI